MEPHHAQSIANLVAAFEPDSSVLALILGGSIAHGFARPDSDIDVSIVVSSSNLQRRRAENRLHYNNRALCPYADGYIDGKYVDVAFLRAVAERGSDPARYAYHGGQILFSRLPELPALLAAIVRYPVEQKAARRDRFAAQLLAWRWYYTQAIRQPSDYLLYLALQKIVLFSGRLVLVENELFFPYHKWLLRVLQSAPRQPPDLAAKIQTLLTAHSWPIVDAYCRELLAFAGIDFAAADAVWPTLFMKDTELTWLEREPCIDDL